MNGLTLPDPTRRQAWRWLWLWPLRLLLWAISLCLAIALGFALYAVAALPPLQPWHTDLLHEEFSALRHHDLDFDGYLQREALLFAELQRTVAGWQRSDEAFVISRFNPDGLAARLAGGGPYNRSMRLAPTAAPGRAARPVAGQAAVPAMGQALLIHGLSDSPYSMKALADSLRARGFAVTLLRLPGHGTLPSMMTEMRLRDWVAAVRIAVRDVAARAPAGVPFYIGGYSTGGTLALLQTLDSLDDPTLRRPDRVLLLSPAIELTPVAALANVIDLFSVLPIPVLDKVHWQEVVAEYDPYKFNSFPVNASRQVNRATEALKSALADAAKAGRLARMPPVVTWQSAVDSTVGAPGVADSLYARLPGAVHRLVLFDLNRQAVLRSVVRPAAGALIERLTQQAHGYTLDIVRNANADADVGAGAGAGAGVGQGSDTVVVARWAPDGGQTLRETALAWPLGLVSLGHVALPFPPDDPVYGFVAGSGHAGLPSIGSWLLRGESGAISLSLGALTRLRSNPFWALVDEDIGALVAADLAR